MKREKNSFNDLLSVTQVAGWNPVYTFKVTDSKKKAFNEADARWMSLSRKEKRDVASKILRDWEASVGFRCTLKEKVMYFIFSLQEKFRRR